MKRNKETGQYEPGIIYELRYFQDGVWTPFYVGETTDFDERKECHESMTRNATEDSYIRYQFAKQLEQRGIEWDMFQVNTYGIDGPKSLEDEHIMLLLVKNIPLTNEKKGNALWMSNKLKEADDMRSRGLTSYKKYKETLIKESLAEKHNRWLKQHHIDRILCLQLEVYGEKLISIKKLKESELTGLYKLRLKLIQMKKQDIVNIRLTKKREKERQRVLDEINAKRAIELEQIKIEQAQRTEQQRKRDAELAELRKKQQAEWEEQKRLDRQEQKINNVLVNHPNAFFGIFEVKK